MKVGTTAAKVEDIAAIERQVEDALLEIASRELGMNKEDLVVRDADPATDFGLSTSEWTLDAAAAGYTTYIDTTVADNRFIAIYGVGRDAGENFTLVKFESGAKTLDIWDASVTDVTQTKIKVARSPIIYRQNMPCKISVYATAAATVKPILLAKVVEPKGKTISP